LFLFSEWSQGEKRWQAELWTHWAHNHTDGGRPTTLQALGQYYYTNHCHQHKMGQSEPTVHHGGWMGRGTENTFPLDSRALANHSGWINFWFYYLPTNNPGVLPYILTIDMHLCTLLPPISLPI
jgi:hypothetical protein